MTNETSGLKFDSDPILKPKIGLVPLRAVWEIAKVMTFGAKKYTKKLDFDSSSMLEWFEEELEQWQNQSVNTVIEANLFMLETCADAAMINGSRQETLSMRHDKEKTCASGTVKIVTGLKSIKLNADKIHSLSEEIRKQSELNGLKTEGSQKKQLRCFYETKEINALSVTEILATSQCTLIITIKQDSREDIYAVSATTVLDSLTTAFTILKRQFPIFRRAQLISTQDGKTTLEVTGAHNWRAGFKYSRLYDAAMRHIIQFTQGEDIDPDSGLHHLAHAGCCITMLLEMTMDRKDLDDRYKENKYLPWVEDAGEENGKTKEERREIRDRVYREAVGKCSEDCQESSEPSTEEDK